MRRQSASYRSHYIAYQRMVASRAGFVISMLSVGISSNERNLEKSFKKTEKIAKSGSADGAKPLVYFPSISHTHPPVRHIPSWGSSARPARVIRLKCCGSVPKCCGSVPKCCDPSRSVANLSQSVADPSQSVADPSQSVTNPSRCVFYFFRNVHF